VTRGAKEAIQRGGSGTEAHVQPDGGADGSGTQLDQVAELVDDPQAVAAPGIRCGPAAAGQGETDLAAVLNLAENLRPAGPDVHDASRTGVAQGVRGELMHRGHQVVGAAARQPGLPALVAGERTHLAETIGVSQGGGMTGRGTPG
jgi:hypothetical protein